jgi:hypothetical protein
MIVAPVDAVVSFVGAVRRRLLWEKRLRRIGTTVGVAGGSVLLGLVAAGLVGTVVPAWIGLFAALVAVCVHVARGRRARRSLREAAAVARHVSRVQPKVGDDLLSLVELRGGRGGLHGSAALIDALGARVASQVGRMRASRFVDLKPARRLVGLRLLALGAATAIAWLALPGVLPRGLALLRGKTSGGYATSVDPIVGDVKLTLTPPKYSGLSSRVIAGSSGAVHALAGTRVQVEARALVGARGAKLVVKANDAERELDASLDGSTLRGEFVVAASGSWRFVLRRGFGSVAEPEPHAVDVEVDQTPRVELFAPAEALDIEPGRRIELGYAVDDDYGLGQIDLVWRVDGDKQEHKKTLQAAPAADAPRTRSFSGKLEWDLAELTLKPGSRVTYHLEARDNDDITGPHVGISKSFVLGVNNPDEAADRRLAALEKLLEHTLTALADRLENAQPTAAAHASLATVVAWIATAQFVEQPKFGAKPKAKDKVGEELNAMHDRVRKISDEESRGLTVALHQRAGDELEKDALFIDDLLGKLRLEALLKVGDEMASLRDRLKELMAEYKRSGSEAIRREIEHQLRLLEQKMAELSAKASRLASEMPDQFLNRQAMGKNDAKDAMSRMREMLEKGDVEGAMAELERMSNALDQLNSSMEGDLRGFRGERFSEDEKALAELDSKIADLQHDESQIRGEAGQLKQRAREAAQRQLQQAGQQALEDIKKQATELKRQLGEVAAPGMRPMYAEDLGRLRQRAADLERLLASKDWAEAVDVARAAQVGSEGLASDLRDDNRRGARGADAESKLRGAARTAREIATKLEQILPRPGENLTPQERERLGQLAERQRALRGQTEQLLDELESRGGDRPKPGSRASEKLRGADEHMEKAEREMRARDARDAEGEAQQALDRLADARKEVQRERRPDEGRGTRADKEPVRIPGADEFTPPKEFRQDLLEAMKRAAPGAYKDAVKRYYEELVK